MSPDIRINPFKTLLVSLKTCLGHTTCGNPTIMDKNMCSNWAMRDTLFDFVGLIKAAFDSTIKLNFNKKT